MCIISEFIEVINNLLMDFEIEVASSEECQKLYHGTSLDNAISIMKNGFKISKSAERKIFFTNIKNYAKAYANWASLGIDRKELLFPSSKILSSINESNQKCALLQVNLENYKVYKIKSEIQNMLLRDIYTNIGGYDLADDENIFEYYIDYDLPADCIEEIIIENTFE